MCRTSSAGDKLEQYPYANSEVRILKAYASKTGWTLARLHIEAVDCEDVEAGFDIDDPWFAVGPNHAAAFLGSGMWLVDAGDYDGDGASELVFSIDRYNRGGYQLFYEHFRKRAVFEFSYH